MEATALSVLPNSQIPKETLEAFYDYCKENPQAKQAVDTVIKAFSPDTIGKFIENCEDVPLPTNSSSFEKFCTKYEYQVETKKEAPKVDSTNLQEAQGRQEIPKQKVEIAEKRQEILNILTP